MTKLQMVEALADDLAVEAHVLGAARQKEIRNTELIIKDHEKQRQFKIAGEVRRCVCASVCRVAHDPLAALMLTASHKFMFAM